MDEHSLDETAPMVLGAQSLLCCPQLLPELANLFAQIRKLAPFESHGSFLDCC
jgi:hypothetical protein